MKTSRAIDAYLPYSDVRESKVSQRIGRHVDRMITSVESLLNEELIRIEKATVDSSHHEQKQ